MASRKVQAKISKMIRQHGRKTAINRAAANDRVSNYLRVSRFNRGDGGWRQFRADRKSAAADIRRARAK